MYNSDRAHLVDVGIFRGLVSSLLRGVRATRDPQEEQSGRYQMADRDLARPPQLAPGRRPFTDLRQDRHNPAGSESSWLCQYGCHQGLACRKWRLAAAIRDASTADAGHDTDP